MSKKASLDRLHELHKLLADYYIEALQSGEELSSGTLAALNTFLKNNDINVDIVSETTGGGIGMTLRKIIQEHEGVA